MQPGGVGRVFGVVPPGLGHSSDDLVSLTPAVAAWTGDVFTGRFTMFGSVRRTFLRRPKSAWFCKRVLRPRSLQSMLARSDEPHAAATCSQRGHAARPRSDLRPQRPATKGAMQRFEATTPSDQGKLQLDTSRGGFVALWKDPTIAITVSICQQTISAKSLARFLPKQKHPLWGGAAAPHTPRDVRGAATLELPAGEGLLRLKDTVW